MQRWPVGAGGVGRQGRPWHRPRSCPLSDIYIVYNDRRDTTGGQMVERALIVKVTNLFTF
jgi:hypothetical protein